MELIYGDALHEMQRMDDGCFDALITDPPYASARPERAEGNGLRR